MKPSALPAATGAKTLARSTRHAIALGLNIARAAHWSATTPVTGAIVHTWS